MAKGSKAQKPKPPLKMSDQKVSVTNQHLSKYKTIASLDNMKKSENRVLIPELLNIISSFLYVQTVDAYIIIYTIPAFIYESVFLVNSKKELVQHFENQTEIFKEQGFKVLTDHYNYSIEVKCIKNNKIVDLAANDCIRDVVLKNCTDAVNFLYDDNFKLALSVLPHATGIAKNNETAKTAKAEKTEKTEKTAKAENEYTIVNFYFFNCSGYEPKSCPHCCLGKTSSWKCPHITLINGLYISCPQEFRV